MAEPINIKLMKGTSFSVTFAILSKPPIITIPTKKAIINPNNQALFVKKFMLSPERFSNS